MQKFTIRPWMIDIVIVTVFFVLYSCLQCYAIGKVVYVATDEGVYLYGAKLISQGYLIYRDFFLGHMPFLMYLNALILPLVKFNLNIFHYIYAFWTISTIIPLYLTIKSLTKNRLAAVLALVVFATFVEMAQWDMHFFAIRQASLPFLAWGIYFLSARKNLILAALFLALFAICLQTNVILAAILLIVYFCAEVGFNKTHFTFKQWFWPTVVFIVPILASIIFLSLVKNGFKDVILFQTDRLAVDLQTRMEMLLILLKQNWPIFAFGLAGSFVFKSKTAYISIFNLLAIPIIILSGNSFYNHYLVVMAVTLTISTGLLLGVIFNYSKYLAIPATFFVVAAVLMASFSQLNFTLIQDRNRSFFETVGVLKSAPEPVLANEPIYALYANKNLTFHYDVADMRHFQSQDETLPEEKYLDLIKNSQSILLEPFLSGCLTQGALDYISENFKNIYDNGNESVWVRR